jgi:prepilin-type N-terminal cleavage/methylation domain-containing protein
MKQQNGFTLVELAIVLMIIGLLIGGILKGQELITNARVTSALRNYKNYDAAVLTFQDSYGALPGDMTNPSTRLPNCSAAPCNIAGNGNGILNTVNNVFGDENATFWLHLAAANMVSGVDMSSTWTSGDSITFNHPKDSLGNSVVVGSFNYPVSADLPEGLNGFHYYPMGIAGGVNNNVTSFNIVGRMDTKVDNGNPSTGTITVSNCTPTAMPTGATTYDASLSSNLCRFIFKAGF